MHRTQRAEITPAASAKGSSFASDLAAFRRAHPGYDPTSTLDELRRREYGRLDATSQLYLDYAGGGLFAERQLRAHADALARSVLGNPHSINPTSLAATQLVQRARAAVLAHFNASPSEYAVVFTANASAALRLVGEAYPFGPGGHLLLTADNHNSVNGLREFCRTKRSAHSYVPVDEQELRLCAEPLRAALGRYGAKAPRWSWRGLGRQASGGRLFAYPAQSNFSGVQHSLTWVVEAQRLGWDVLLDASAFVPTNRLDLGRVQPDFVTLSFYKMMGYPTGLGCLLARREALARLRRPWFAGGAVVAVTVKGDDHRLADAEAGFEDGTVDYLSIPAVDIGLAYLNEVGIEAIHQRVQSLTTWLLGGLRGLRHSNGLPLVRLYGPINTIARGGIVTFNFLDPSGRIVDERLVERLALEHQISLRTGCFCNPGAAEIAFGIDTGPIGGVFEGQQALSYDRYIEGLGLPSAGAIRVSLGVASSFADVHRFLEIAQGLRDLVPNLAGLPPRDHC